MQLGRNRPPDRSGTDAIDRELDLESARFWRATVARLTREINPGWWLSAWLPSAVVTGLVGMVAML